MDCGAGNTAESCGSCVPCATGGDCQPDPVNQGGSGGPGGPVRKKRQAPQCIESGNYSSAKSFQPTKKLFIDFQNTLMCLNLFCYRYKYNLSKLLPVASLR